MNSELFYFNCLFSDGGGGALVTCSGDSDFAFVFGFLVFLFRHYELEGFYVVCVCQLQSLLLAFRWSHVWPGVLFIS